MLIVAAWQSVPFSALAKIFKRRKLFDIMVFAVCSIAFVALDFFNATAIIFMLIIFSNRKAHSAERGVAK